MRYTAGELAKKLGVSARTVRFYDEKELLNPCDYSESGYRLYDENSVLRLQKILMLKYMDFSLEQIADMMKKDEAVIDMQKSLEQQEELLLDKREHITRLIEAIRKTKNSDEEQFWPNLRHVIELTRDREEVIAQYKSDDNLKKRISIHDYSTAETEWFHWLFEKEQVRPGMKILDIGCGNATLWKRVAALLPEDLEVHLVDYSDGMLKCAREVAADITQEYPEKNLRFVIEKRDAADFSYPTSGFDLIMANHMLYHVAREHRLQLYPKIKSLLAEGGRFTCTLIGQQHMKEMHDFVTEYYPGIKFPSGAFDIWLETAREELKSYFNVLSVEEHENDLYVPDEQLIFNYVASYSEEAKERISRDKEAFFKRVQSKMNEDGTMYIHKSTGVVICEA
ncbi:MerR family transcriptional regulator [Butyrivibrio sp. CB08]|uniref:MerR family transcriptional regulator n=1 Tax=Butyrivibrio sp. CB08 TaxID=2364879 RepID=UPI000EA9F434|nr:MerR family transcriptional regulator [Butyrivibrio sp. CB08]RKM61486.1 MerR family transcriptional regulator [Butyrivibrio sp. CB08]